MAVEFKVPHSRTGSYHVLPEHITIKPEMNGRHETPDIEWLIEDIVKEGQHTPVIVRNDGGQCVLVAGFSRWRAVSEINKRQLTPLPVSLVCRAVKCNEIEAFMLNISENRFRNATTPLDDAHNMKRLLKLGQTDEQICKLFFPTAKTEEELREAKRFVADRMALIDLAPEAEQAVREGRVSMPAAKVIAKMTSENQRLAVAKPGTIERKDVVAPKAVKAQAPCGGVDAKTLKLLGDVFEYVEGLLDSDLEWVEVDRVMLKKLHDHVKGVK